MILITIGKSTVRNCVYSPSVKTYAVTAIMKIYSFEIAAGKKVDILPECQSLIEEMLASHSTDLQQRAYELQAILGLDADAIVIIMPKDSTCEDIEIDKNLSFLDDYVQQALEKGAEPYVERFSMSNIGDFIRQEDHEPSTHALRFEAYELPKPSPPVLSSTNALVPVPEPSYVADIPQPAQSFPSTSASSELKLRLDGVQKKWGRPTYSSATPPTSSTNTVKIQNEPTQYDSASSSNSKAHNTFHDSKKQQEEVPLEKQKLAASLFGASAKSERRQSSSHKAPKTQNHTTKSASSDTTITKTSQPPPDLLDLGEPSVMSSTPAIDPFKQLEGLLDLTQDSTSTTEAPDFTSMFADMSVTDSSELNILDINGVGGSTEASKGPDLKKALEKDARVRQVGVTPSGQNPNLFKDLLG